LETWLDVEDFPLYEVSDLGRVRNKDTEFVLKPLSNGRDSLVVILRRDNRGHTRSIRRLVALAFLGEPYGSEVALPIDGDYNNNAADNLVYKPMWFAQRAKKQHRRRDPIRHQQVRVIETGDIYANTLACAEALGLLEDYVLLAARKAGTVRFGGLSFEFV